MPALLATTVISFVPFLQPLHAETALPDGASVAAGRVTIDRDGNRMKVQQGSDRGIVNWNGFSIGEGASVDFRLPDRNSAILNRVTGKTTSKIAGSLTGNGQVFLINPNGIAITETGSVKVGGGFVASTLDMDDEDFLGARLTFSGDGESAAVRNEGVISVGRGGYAALLGGTIRNDGLIAAPMGKIGFGAGEQATIDLSGDRFLSVALPTQDGAEGDGALIDNAGTVSASGGHVVMQAATVRHAARHAVNLSGVAEATTVGGRSGAIVLGGGAGGKLAVSGSVRTSAPSGKGGDVTVTGKTVSLSGARLDASGATGGGSIRVGGDWQGSGDLLRADLVRIDTGTTLSANATRSGNGGEVVLWSDRAMDFGGRISATGAGTGRGGDAEVSGKVVLSYNGFADLTGPRGFGTLLLDPYNMTITDAEGAGTSLTASGEDSTLSASALEQQLATANVTVTTGTGGAQAGDITVASDIDWGANTTLTLDAANDILINADITGTGTGSGVALSFGGDYAVNGSVTLTGSGASLSVNGDAYTLIQSREDLEAVNDDLEGKYAVVKDIDLAGETYDKAIIGQDSDFNGYLSGFGHTISNPKILDLNNGNVFVIGNTGLIGRAGSRSFVRDLGVVDASVSGKDSHVGILAGSSFGSVHNVFTTGSVDGHIVGGLIGNFADGSITESYSTADVGRAFYAGGLIGVVNDATVSDVYATGSATGRFAGGLAAVTTRSEFSNSYAVGKVTGSISEGGLFAAQNFGSLRASYWDTASTGVSVAVNYSDDSAETMAVGFSTEGFQDTEKFIALAETAGWDFDKVWLPPSEGYYPELYGASDAVFVTGIEGGVSASYGDTFATLNGKLSVSTGSAGVLSGDRLSGAVKVGVDTSGGVEAGGSYTLTDPPFSMIGSDGKSYRIVILPLSGDATVTPRALTVTAKDALRTYGDAPAALDYSLTNGTLVGADVLSGALASNGNAARAGATTYAIGKGTLKAGDNYAMTFEGGTLTVTPRGITVAARAASKIYGETTGLVYEITEGALIDGDSLSGTLASEGAAARAGVDSYAITQGTLANGNYSITFEGATLTVTQRGIRVAARDVSMTEGQALPALTFDIVDGDLVNGDLLEGVLATLAGSQSPARAYDITQGTLANGNYAISFENGTLTIAARPVEPSTPPAAPSPPRGRSSAPPAGPSKPTTSPEDRPTPLSGKPAEVLTYVQCFGAAAPGRFTPAAPGKASAVAGNGVKLDSYASGIETEIDTDQATNGFDTACAANRDQRE